MIVANEKVDFALTRVIANVVGSHDGNGGRFVKGNSRAINSSAIAAADHAIDPGMNVGALFGKHPAALFLIEKKD